ncbi:Hsp20/alpha crystallin family protein NDAI_0C02790 [Naumovozyma dairenensis CBS 421]|uniref:SHSP domain-containing protein n=1 Tax=Naumovozyma dairenensis (strain ATCC 10597 / BCRC 20456 / CBS 421 / NBRC 0211 / NRRL Y-12639) TaxID=1071378 RepID=G0W828_NAUDC|nr:hypothetical protein NDAI_0C02790 [Naumovozyma dairenensis CBS 421]CCD23939.1 hypothetical protein NDAI_0C02790 [Naumovozyma dairenensis CBS 421]
MSYYPFHNFSEDFDEGFGIVDSTMSRARRPQTNRNSNIQGGLIRPGNNDSMVVPRYGPSDLDNWFDTDIPLVPMGFGSTRNLTVPIDILDHDNNYEIKVNIPGVRQKKNISLEYNKNKNQFSISGEIPPIITEERSGNVRVQERASGKFRRSVTLPEYPKINVEQAKADYTSGILTLEVPKVKPSDADKEQVRRIEIVSDQDWEK